MKKIVICGGHFTPAQALIEELEKVGQYQMYFFGRKFVTEGNKNISAEFKQISKSKVIFKNMTAGRIPRHLTAYTLVSLLKIPVGFFQSFYYLLTLRPNLVVTFGGSLSFPVIFSAWLLGIDAVTHEQAVVPTLSNRLNSLFAKRIYVSWDKSKTYFPKEKTMVIGNLVRSSLLKGVKEKGSLSKRGKLFIAGGNQGSHFLNKFVFENIQKLDKINIAHQVGTANFKNDQEKAAVIKRKNYQWFDYVGPEQLKKIFEEAQIILCRAGANTVWELAMFGKVAILIPLPHSAGSEQQKNAEILKNVGSAVIIKQSEANPQRILDTISAIGKNYTSMQKSALSFAKTIPRNASQLLAKEIGAILKS